MNKLTSSSRMGTPIINIKKFAIIISVLWSGLVTLMLGLEIVKIRGNTQEIALKEASAILQKDLAIRKWATSHGGVYVPVDERTPSSPFLSGIEERDLVTPSGRKLTLMNPAYVMRQIQEDYHEKYGIKSHLTSLKLLRPENAPDGWEKNALRRFESGDKKVIDFVNIDNKPYLRAMRPIYVEEGCLKCHGHQGYDVGDIRGGLSISIPMGPYIAEAGRSITLNVVTHGATWLLGLLGIGMAYVLLQKRIRENSLVEQSLLKSKASLSEAQRISHLGSWDLNLITNNLVWSDEVYRMFGMKPQEFGATFEAFLDNIHPDDREMVNTAYTVSVKNKVPYEIVHRLLLKDGTLKYVNERCETFYDENGNPLRSMGTVQDITELRIAEDLLHENEKKFRQFFENAPDYFYMVSPEGNIIDINSAALSALGYMKEELIGKPLLKTIYPSSMKEKVKEVFKEWTKKGKLTDVELDIITKTGDIKNILLSVDSIRNMDGEVLYSISVQKDITDRKKADVILREQKHNLSERVKELKCSYGIAMSIRERDTKEEIFSDVIALIPPGWHYPEITRARIVFNGVEYSSESFVETEWKQMSDIIVDGNKRGTVEVYYIELCPELDEGPFLKEERNLIDTIARSLSEMVKLKQAEKELSNQHLMLLQTNKELEKSFEQEAQLRDTLVRAEKLASLGEMAAKIAHEINNPLTVIMGQAELQAQQITDPDLKKPYEKIAEKAEQIRDLTRRYMDLAKPTEIKMINLKFKSVIQSAIESLRPLGQLKHIGFVESYVDREPEILGDSASLEQVIRNLLINSADAVHGMANSKISVGTKLSKDGKAVIAFVTDNGEGINPDDIKSIFDHYYTTKESGKGTGLGLVIVKEIIEVMHGGTIAVESEPGKRTIFSLSIPLADYSMQKKKILIVDDDAYIGDLFSEFLSSRGFLVRTSLSGREALRLFSDFEPDLVLSDYEMPEMNGLELYEAIKEINPRQTFVMITGAFMLPEVLKFLREKQIPQIIKPAELENELLKIVNEQLEKKLD